MKKALVVLGFALCATMAFAQTKVVSRDNNIVKAQKPDLNALKASKQVDYKASIFTKDAIFDTVHTFDFSNMTGIDTAGYVQQNDVIVFGTRDSVFATTYNTVHVDNETWCKWRHYADTNDFVHRVNSEYPIRGYDGYGWLMEYTEGSFMFFGYDYDQRASAGVVNTFFTLPAQTRTASNKVVHIALSQVYRKYYDQCFIDYKMPDGKWHTREINVIGVDCNVNEFASLNVRYVMPLNLANQTNIELRVRTFSRKRGSTYGYFWFINSLSILSDNRAHSWEFNTSCAFDGFYGMIPQGMNIPLTYGTHVRNTNLNPLSNAKITITNAPANGTFTEVASGTPWTVPTGDVESDYRLYINERGFLVNTSHDDDTNYGWNSYSFFNRCPNYGVQGAYSGNYQGRGLNTQTPGQNFYRILGQYDSVGGVVKTSVVRDSVLYTVSSNLQFDPEDPLTEGRVDGYRWARDNGIIPSYSAFKISYNADGLIDADDEEGHAYQRGYQVMVRYITGDQIPDGYVFKGVEFVPSTAESNPNDMVGAPIYPIVYSSNGGVEWEDVNCGIDNMVFTVDSNAVNNLPARYALPSSQSNYSAFNVKFLDEPQIKKNTAYYFGYVLNDNAGFRVAAQQNRFRDGDSLRYYSSTPETQPYSRQNYPFSYLDMLVYDRASQGNTNIESPWLTGWYMDNFPMIRPIIGAPDDVERIAVAAVCNNLKDANGNDTLGIIVEHGDRNICGDVEESAKGSVQLYYIAPFSKVDHTVIDTVFLDGVALPVRSSDYTPGDNENWVLYEYDYDVEDTITEGNIILYRKYYALRCWGLDARDGGHVITASFHWEPYDLSGIDPVAPEVRFGLAPNPATSTVKVKVAGVTGMANCSILDMSGRVVYNRDINTEAETIINVSNIPAGAYFVRITNNTFSKIEKLIIK